MNDARTGPASGRSRRCPTSRPALREHGLPLYSLETFTPLCRVRRARLLAPVRDLLHERPDDARPGRHPAARRGPRAGRHAGDRRRARRRRTRSCSRRSSTCSSSATASRACRSSATCGKSMQGTRACRATRSWRGSPASVEWAYVPRFYEPDLRARTARSPRSGRTARRRARSDQAVRDPTTSTPSRCRRGRSSRSSRRRTTGSPSRSCAAAPGSAGSARARSSSGRCAIARSRRSSQAALESYRNTGYDEISLLSLSTSDYPDFEELVTRMSEVFTPLGVKISLPSLRITETLKKIPALLAGRPAERPDAGARGRARRHARADPQADQQRGPVRRLRRGVPPRLAQGQALLHVRPARRADRRPRRHRRDGRDDRPDRQGGDRPLRRGDGQRLELRPQAAHALSVERHADRASTSTGRTATCDRGSGSGR